MVLSTRLSLLFNAPAGRPVSMFCPRGKAPSQIFLVLCIFLRAHGHGCRLGRHIHVCRHGIICSPRQRQSHDKSHTCRCAVYGSVAGSDIKLQRHTYARSHVSVANPGGWVTALFANRAKANPSILYTPSCRGQKHGTVSNDSFMRRDFVRREFVVSMSSPAWAATASSQSWLQVGAVPLLGK